MQKLSKSLIALFLGLCLSLCSVGNLNQTLPALAAISPIETPEKITNLNENLFGEIDNFIKSIPHGYYTVMKVDSLKRLIQREKILLVDVREPAEYAAGHIPGAINIPLRTLTQNLDKIPKNRSVVLYCSSGYRTAMGVMALQMLGYKKVMGFPPSIQGWKAAGESLESGTA